MVKPAHRGMSAACALTRSFILGVLQLWNSPVSRDPLLFHIDGAPSVTGQELFPQPYVASPPPVPQALAFRHPPRSGRTVHDA